MIEGQWRLRGDGITGWARSVDSSSSVWVELLADGEPVGVALANLPGVEDCAFWLPVAPALLETDPLLEVRAVNTWEYIARMDDGEAEDPAAGLIGEIYTDGALTFQGWVADPDDAGRELTVTAYIDGQEAGKTVAGLRKYKPRQADGHAFSLTLADKYADGNIYYVELRDDRGWMLPGCPHPVCSWPSSVSESLKSCRKPERQFLTAVGNILDIMERRVPGIGAEIDYAAWKKAFPVPAPAARQKASVAVLGAKGAIIGEQQGGEFRCRQDVPEYVLLADADVRLHNFALAHMVGEMRRLGADAAYADGETPEGRPLFKPAWDREAFLARDYLGPLLVSGRLFRESGVTSLDSPGAARLKVALTARRGGIIHLPMPLYAGSHAQSDPVRDELIAQWLRGAYGGASWRDGRAHYVMRDRPRISIIIPTRDHGDLLKTCLDSLKQTSYPDYEIIIIDNGSVEDDALAILARAGREANVCVLRRPGIFNYADLNNRAVLEASGEFVCFLNNDTEALHPEWLEELASLLSMAGEAGGCVGAKLLWPNGLVQHGGVVVGIHQLAGHVGNQWLEDDPGYMGRNQFVQRYSAVTGACLLTPRALFLESGGFDGRKFPVAFNDVDYCLRVGAQGKHVFWTPYARLAHHESASRGREALPSGVARSRRENALFRAAWGLYDDPFYNPNLPLSAATEPFMGLAFPPRSRKTRQEQ